MDALSKGKVLLQKLYQVVNQADINSKQATQAASYGVEQTIEILHGRKKKLEDAFKDRNKLLEQSVKSSQLDEQIKQYTTWLQNEGELFLTQTNTSFGNSTEDAEKLMKKHIEFAKVLKAKHEAIQRTIRDGQKLINSHHFDSATIKYKIGKLDQMCTTFSQKLEQRENVLNQTVKFLRSSVPVVTSLDTIKLKLQSKKLSESEKLRQRKDATEVSSSILREGQILATKTKSKTIIDVLKSIKDKYNYILVLTEKGINSDDDDVILISRELDRISNWITNVGEDFVNFRKSVGNNKIQAEEFEKDHQDLFEELNSISKQINEIRATVTGFSKKKKKIVFDFMERLDIMLELCGTISSRLKYRLLLVKMFIMFLKHSEDVLKKIFMLEEELTSDEPHENINATTTTLNRQKQEKEEIINTAEILQEEGQRMLEDLSLCPEESILDRNAIKLKIGKDLKNIVLHTMQLEELWEQRESQLDRNKRLSTQFFEFEKEIRKVIGWIHNQSETFFPLSGEFPGLKSIHSDLQERLVQLQTVAQLANTEIESHLEFAQNFAKTSKEGQDGVQAVTVQLKLVHQKFRTKLSKYEALLSMCSTFYTSVEKLVTLMNKALQEYTSDFLPRDTIFAVQKLRDNSESFQGIEELFGYTLHNGHDVLQSIREYDSIDGKAAKIEEALKSTQDPNWKAIWEENQKNLDDSLLILQILQQISQLTLVVEEQTRRLLKINSTFGNSLLSAVTFCQESDTFQDEVKATEQQIGQLKTSISKLVQAKHADGFQLEVKLNLLERRWGKLAELMEGHKSLLNSAVEFYQLCEQVETWLKDSNQFVKTTRAGARRCTTEKEIRELIDLVDNFKFSGVEIQESRLQSLSEMSSVLNTEDAKARAGQLKESQDKVNTRLEKLRSDMETQISRIQTNDVNVPLLWDNDDDTIEVLVPEKRITLSNAAESPLLSDLSIHGDETMKWKDDLSENANGRPKLLVTVSSNNQVPADMQKRISPIVRTEIDEFAKKDVARVTVGQPATFTFGLGTKNIAIAPAQRGGSSGNIPMDVISTKAGRASVMGPQVQTEISVKTDYDIETSPPSPSPDEGGLMYTMKKTLITTTKEVTTLTRQEIKTELEVVHIDNENELPMRIAVSSRESDKVGVSVTTVSGMAPTPGSLEDYGDVADALKKELQGTNENICKGVEGSLFAGRQHMLDDSYVVTPHHGIIPAIQAPTGSKPKYEVFAKDANNKGMKVRHIPKSNTIMASLPIKSDDRPVSMVELTLNLDSIDFESEEQSPSRTNSMVLQEERIDEEMIPQPVGVHNVNAAIDELPPVPEPVAEKKTLAPVNVVLKMGTPLQQEKKPHSKLEETISESKYTEGLVNIILQESVQELDPMVFLTRFTGQNVVYLSMLQCTIKTYMDKITVAPLKLQKNKDAIFRNIKDLLHFQKNVLAPATMKCKNGDDIANCYIHNYEKFSKLYYIYISKAAELDRILTNTSYFADCNAHKSHLQEHLDCPQTYLTSIITILQDCIVQTELLNKDTIQLKIALQLLQNVKDLSIRDAKEVIREVEANCKNLDTRLPVQGEHVAQPQNGSMVQSHLGDDMLDEYDIISVSEPTTKSLNGHNGHRSDFETVKNKPRYVVWKGYTAKRKDEIYLPLGTEVTILENQNDRSYVVAFTKQNTELDRGWIPTYCLQLKEEAIEITSKEAKPPAFASQLVSTSIVEGNSAELSVQVTGFPKPEITWYLDGLPVRNDINHHVVWDGDFVSLKITPAVIDDEGIYTVKAVNALGSATCQAEFIVESDVSSMSGISDIEWEESKPSESRDKKIHVGDRITFRASLDSASSLSSPPSVAQRLEDTTVVLGCSATFEVQADGEPQPSVTWFLNNRKVENDKRIIMSKERSVHTITFLKITEKDLGTLKCVLTNFAGKDECSCTLAVAQDVEEDLNNNSNTPTLFAKTNNLQVLKDHDAEFTVEFSGSPEPEINWYKESIHMTEDYGAEITRVSSKCTMILKEICKDDEGEYTCIAKNGNGEVKCKFMLKVLTMSDVGDQAGRPASILITDEGPPVILEKFIDKECYEGDTAKFQVKAKGVPTPKITWYFNDMPVTQSGNVKLTQERSNYILTILVCDKQYSGRYKCVAENERGKVEAEDDIVIHESIYPPKFLHQTKNVAVNANGTCTISAVIKGKPRPSVEWYKDNRCLDERSGAQFINSDDQYSLVIQRFTEKHAGSYKCSAFNDAGESSCVTDVTLVKEKCSPRFLEPVSDTNVSLGGTVRLTTTISCHPAPKVTWLKDGEVLRDGSKYSLEKTSDSFVLVVQNSLVEDSGIYQCVAENVLGKEVCECQLEVTEPFEAPIFIKPLANFSVLEHQKDVEMQVIVEGNPKPDVLFYKDGTILQSSARRKLVRENQQHTLHWKYVLPDDSGNYSVVASNSEGEQVSTCTMSIVTETKAPEFLPHESSVSAAEGEEISITIKAEGVPTPEISWTKDKTPVSDGENVSIMNNLGTSTLTINSASLKDAGDYQSLAQNSSGASNTVVRVEVAELKKQFPPEFTSSLNDVEVSFGGEAVLELGIAGYPEPKVQWKKDGTVLADAANIQASYRNGVYTLTLIDCQKDAAGCYECVASNEVGEVVCQCLLTVQKNAGKEIKRTASEKSKAPKFLQTLHDLTIHLSEPIVLETVVGGTPFPDIRWYKQDKLLHPNKRMKIGSSSKDGKSFLRMVNAGKDDAGEYEIVAKNKHGETSMSCEVFVKDLIKVSRDNSKMETNRPMEPSITNKPEENTINEGDEIKFQFTVNGFPRPTVEILKDSNPFKQPAHIVTQFEENIFTFFTNECKTSDEAVYEFIVSNKHGKTTFKYEILVDEIGELEVVAKTIGSDSRRQSKEESLALRSISSSEEEETLRASLSPKPPSKRLKKHKKLVPREKSSGGEESDTDGIDGGLVSEDVVQSVDEQIVQASSVQMNESTPPITESPAATVKSSDTMEPVFIEEPQNQKVMEGRPLKLTAKVEGKPEPTVKWFKDGKQLENGDGINLEYKKGQARLKINKSKEKDGGEYVCWVENDVNKTMTPVMVDIVMMPTRPEWTTKMQDTSITEGEDVTFEVGISGLPYPDVQWFQDNRLLAQSDRVVIHSDKDAKCHKLTIKNCSLREGRNLKCIARNTQGTNTCMASLKVQEAVIAPQFTIPLQDGEVMQTEDIKLKVGFTGKPKPLVEWSINDQIVKSSQKIKIRNERESSQLTIPGCKDEHTGQYKAVCSNVAGEAVTQCKITVTEELRTPDFTNTPKNVKCVEGRNATFKISFTGKPQPDVKWTFKGTEIQPTESIEIKKDNGKTSLVIKSCTLGDAGCYACEISNKADSKTCNVELIVEEGQSKPVITEKFKETTVKEKGTLELSVLFKGKPKPTVQWSKNEIKLKQDARFSFSEDQGRATLKLTGAATTDTGNYKVTLKNSQGDVNCKAKVLVEEEVMMPSFVTPSADAVIIEGEPLVLSVKAEGIPKPKLQWTKDGVELSPKGSAKLNNTNEELKIAKCKISDSGVYECNATSKVGSERISFTVQINPAPEAPVFSQKPDSDDVALFEGDLFLQHFSVAGHPPPKIEVTRDDEPVTKPVIVDYNAETGEGTLEIPSVSPNDAGVYKVVAVSDVGSTQFTVALTLNDPDDLMFLQKIADVSTMEDGNAILEVKFKGHVVDVDWYKDNEYIDESDKYEIIDEEDRCTCVVHNCTVADAGNYRCEILNEKKSESCSAVITVKEGVAMPAFLEQLKDETVEEGKKLVMEVISEGKPEPAIKWLKNGNQVVNGVNVRLISDGRVHSLTIPNVTQRDGGFYVCRLSNSVGVVECKAKIDITEASSLPTISKPLEENMEFEEGKEAVLLFSFDGVKSKASFYKDDKELVPDKRITILPLGKNTIQLTMKYLTEEDAGTYSARAYNPNGFVSSDTTITILPTPKSPKFESILKDAKVLEGGELVLNVRVDGVPPPRVSFFKDGVKLTSGENCDISLEDNLVVLRKQEVGFEDSGVYLCEIKNDLGSTKCQSTVNITRKSVAVELTQVLEDSTLKEGDEMTLQVVAKGYPTPTFEWFKNGEPLQQLDIQNEDLTSFIRIPNCSLSDAGVFKCVSSNGDSSASTECTISIKPQEIAPGFKTELSDQTAYVDDSLCLELAINGYPRPTIQWFKDGHSIEGNTDYIFENDLNAGTIKLIVQDPEEKYSGAYKVVLLNELGETSTECNVNITKKPEKPTFTKTFEDQNVDEHSTVCLATTVVGIPTPEIQWLKDGLVFDTYETSINEDGNVETKVEFADSSPDHSGKYTCTAKNDAGENQQSVKVVINAIIYPPKFEYELKDYSGFEGDEVVISTECSGSLPQNQKWTKNGKAIHNTSSTRVVRSDNMDHKFMLKIPNAKVTDTGAYELEVTNSSGSCVTSCKLEIQEQPILPQFVIKLKDQNNLVEGRNLECSTKVSGKPIPTIRWFVNDIELVNDDNTLITLKEDGKSTLILKNLKPEQNGTLRCDAVNLAGTVSSSCKLKIAESTSTPEFVKPLEDLTVEEGEPIVLAACITGKPQPSILWTKSRKPVVESDHIQILQEGDEHKLVVNQSTTDDGGRYKIVATNSAGDRFSSASVTVNQKLEAPMFTKPLSNLSVPKGQMLVLEVEYTGSPKPRIKWKSHDRNLKFDKRFQIIDVSDNISRLEMLEFTKDDAGEFTCSLSNESGEVTCECVVGEVEDTSAPVFTAPLKDLHLNQGENLVLDVVTEAVPEAEIKFYKDDMVLQNIDGIFIENDNGKWTVTIEDVDPEDSGRYICKASNSGGEVACACNVVVIESEKKQTKMVLTPLQENTAVTTEKGKSVKFEAQVSGETLPLVEWAFGEALLDPSDKYEIIDDNGYNSLTIHDVTSEDEGEYSCIADVQEDGDDDEIQFTLTIAGQSVDEDVLVPSTLQQSESYPDDIHEDEIQPEEEISVEKPAPVVENLIAAEPQQQVESLPTDVVPTKPKSAPEVLPKKKTVPPPVAKKTKKPVKEPSTEIPRFSMKPKDKDASYGSEVTFTCNASGSPETSLQWFFEGVPLQDSAKYAVKLMGGSSTLIINEVASDDIGEYKVVAKNDAGENEIAFFLSVDGQSTRSKEGEGISAVQEESDTTDGPSKGPVNVSIEFHGEVTSDGSVPVNGSNKEGEGKPTAPVEVALLVDTKPEPAECKPSLVSPLESQTAIEGDDVTLKAQFDGTPPLEFSWFKDEIALIESPRIVEVDDGNTAILELKNVKVEDEAEYVCIAANEFGGCETTAELLVDEKEDPVQAELDQLDSIPSQTSENKPTEELGNTDGKATGPPPTAKKPKPAKPETKPKTKKGDNKRVVEDVIGAKEISKVETGAPEQVEFVKELKDTDICVGESLELSVKTSLTAQFGAQWLCNGEILVEEEGLAVVNTAPVYSLKLDDLMPEDEGEYSVELKNPKDGQLLTSSCMVYVSDQAEKPEIAGELETMEAEAGETAEFRVLVYSTQALEVEWFFKGEKIRTEGSDAKYEIGQEGDEYFLLINKCDADDTGEYSIDIKNSAGVVTSDGFLDILQPIIPPKVFVLPEFEGGCKLTEGEDLRLEFDIESESETIVRWLKNGKEVKENEAVEIFCDNQSAFLLVLNASVEKSGSYVAIIENSAGEEKVTFDVLITGNY